MFFLWNSSPMYVNNPVYPSKTAIFAGIPKYEVPPNPTLRMSSACVNGLTKAAYCATTGSCSNGMNIPLMNIIGILMKFRGIITSPGFSVGIEANMIPIMEKARLGRSSPINNATRLRDVARCLVPK